MQKMAGSWVPLPGEVIELLAPHSDACMKDYVLMLNRFYVEQITDAEGEWVVGRIDANITKIAARIGVGRGWFIKRIWPTWTEIGIARQAEDGFIEVPMLYRKGELYQMPLPVRRELTRLTQRIEELESELQNRENAEKARDEASSGTERGLIRDIKRPHPGHIEAPTSFLKVLKKDKNSLSGDNIISGFYRLIGQKRISKAKRERGLKVFRNLRKDGFNLEDIAFAVEWTVENPKEEIYDFAIIQHTIGQAIAARDKQESDQRELEKRENALQEERARRDAQEQEREQIEAYKANLSAQNRAALRERAEAEISASGKYNPGLISEPLIAAKENEIVRNQLDEER